MIGLGSLINSCARRITFSIKHGEDYYIAFSVIEVLEKDMQDIDDYPLTDENPCIKRAKNTSSTNEYNVYMSVDRIILTKEFIERPEKHFKINDTTFRIWGDTLTNRPSNTELGYVLKDSFSYDNGILSQVLPIRQCSKIVYAFLDESKLTKGVIMNNISLVKQLSQLSSDEYGTDLTLYPEHLGNIYFVQYNPYFRAVDFSGSNNPNGLFATFRFRPGYTANLIMRIANKNKAGFYLDETTAKIDSSHSEYFIPMKAEPDVIDIKVFDEKGALIYYQNDMSFIRQININMNIKSADISIATQSKSGNKEEKVEKFISNDIVIGETPKTSAALDEKISEDAYRTLEKRLEFILFDGNKEKKEENVTKAKSIVREILKKAQRRCYICDPYFNLQNMIDFVFTMPQLHVDVKVLACQEFLAKNAAKAKIAAKDLDNAIELYNKRVGCTIQMRLLSGQSPLHDRFIICDDSVWLLGSSFNEFGNRATTIVKVPPGSCPQLYSLVEKWWFDENLSISLIDYANS